MNALTKTFKTTFKWFGIFIACTLVATGLAFFQLGGAAAAEKLVGFGGASVLFTIIIFFYSLFSNIFSKSAQKPTDE